MQIFSVLAYFIVGLVIWYIAYGLETYVNGGSLGRGRWWVFECFWEEMLWFLPGGLQKRTDYIRDMVRPTKNDYGFVGGYSYEEIREKNLYEEVAKKALGRGYYFWGVNVILPIFFWPLAILCLSLLIVGANLYEFVCHLLSRRETKGEASER